MRGGLFLAVAAAGAIGWYAWRHVEPGAPPPPPRGDAPVVAAPDGEADAGPPPTALRPAPRPGEEIDLELLEPPAERYGAATVGPADEPYRQAVAAAVAAVPAAAGAVYDPDLGRAAREVAYYTAIHGGTPPEEALTLLLHAAGAPELGAAQSYTYTTSESPDALREAAQRALAEPVPGDGPLRIGVGEVSTSGEAYSRHLCVLVARRSYQLAPAPRRVDSGGRWQLRGRVDAGWHDLEASALYPDGRMAELPLERGSDGGFALTVDAGDRPGPLAVGIDGTGPTGPGKLLQLTVEVGPALPRRFHVRMPDADPRFADLAAAEAYALQRLDEDRAAAGVPPLTPDPALAAIARAHSTDMRDHGFFGHLSPRTGLAGDRLAAARYRETSHAENLARNDSVGDAEASLLGSVGHRRNLLDPRFSRVGVGLAATDGEPRQWYLTQLFARPVEQVAPDQVVALILDRVAAARARAGSAPLAVDASLAAIAQGRAARAAAGELEGLAGEVSRAAAPHVGHQVAVSVHGVYDLEAFVAPDAALDPQMQSIGVGAVQSEADIAGRIGVIIILGK